LKDHWREESKVSTDIRRVLILLDLAIAGAIGMIEDGLVLPPYDWFKIEIVFARWAGVGAGTCLHYTLRLALTYKGAFAWKMQAGMGDTIFAPFYEVL